MLPFTFNIRSKIFSYYTGFSFFIFIWVSEHAHDRRQIINHEKIHFYQQLEMLFIFHWLFYLSFYLVYRAKGMDHFQAYYRIPFEKEAYDHEAVEEYLRRRRPYSWVKYW